MTEVSSLPTVRSVRIHITMQQTSNNVLLPIKRSNENGEIPSFEANKVQKLSYGSAQEEIFSNMHFKRVVKENHHKPINNAMLCSTASNIMVTCAASQVRRSNGRLISTTTSRLKIISTLFRSLTWKEWYVVGNERHSTVFAKSFIEI
jgi:hypothetical protein